MKKKTPLSVMPLYVRAGSIVPMGPEEQYAGEHPNQPIRLRIYPGKNGEFELYEDDGSTYDYEKGQYAWIGIHWNNKTRVLKLDKRRGSFPGMRKSIQFSVVIVGLGHGTGEPVSKGGRMVRYDGRAESVRL